MSIRGGCKKYRLWYVGKISFNPRLQEIKNCGDQICRDYISSKYTDIAAKINKKHMVSV